MQVCIDCRDHGLKSKLRFLGVIDTEWFNNKDAWTRDEDGNYIAKSPEVVVLFECSNGHIHKVKWPAV